VTQPEQAGLWQPSGETYWHGRFQLRDGQVVGPGRAGNESRLARRLAIVKQLIERQGGLSGRRVLDVGCADGFFSFAASRWGASEVVGLDISEHEIRKAEWLSARMDHGPVRFTVADLRDLAPRDEPDRFDVVMCHGVFYHYDDPVGLMARLAGSARGALVLDTDTLPLPERLMLLEYEKDRAWSPALPVWVPTQASLLLLAAHAGFRSYTLPRIAREDPVDYRSGRRMTIYFSKSADGAQRLPDPAEVARPADDQASAPFTWRYRRGNGAYRGLRAAHRLLGGAALRW
jgi:SAM-dependent methyltransferase